MAASSKRIRHIVGIILAVVGVALLIWGYQDSQSIGNEITSVVSGSPTDDVVYRYIGGAAALAVGLYMFLSRR